MSEPCLQSGAASSIVGGLRDGEMNLRLLIEFIKGENFSRRLLSLYVLRNELRAS